jgi:hypothetical protein
VYAAIAPGQKVGFHSTTQDWTPVVELGRLGLQADMIVNGEPERTFQIHCALFNVSQLGR